MCLPWYKLLLFTALVKAIIISTLVKNAAAGDDVVDVVDDVVIVHVMLPECECECVSV
jgi:hypothetical protein